KWNFRKWQSLLRFHDCLFGLFVLPVGYYIKLLRTYEGTSLLGVSLISKFVVHQNGFKLRTSFYGFAALSLTLLLAWYLPFVRFCSFLEFMRSKLGQLEGIIQWVYLVPIHVLVIRHNHAQGQLVFTRILLVLLTTIGLMVPFLSSILLYLR
ncbi:hypothetical protein MKW98_015803, partial [Papaver atlanticum]